MRNFRRIVELAVEQQRGRRSGVRMLPDMELYNVRELDLVDFPSVIWEAGAETK